MSSWTWGQVAYDKYVEYWTGNGLMPLGIQWVEWDELPVDEREAWAAAAQAVRDAAVET
jgi:hypothetical protein